MEESVKDTDRCAAVQAGQQESKAHGTAGQQESKTHGTAGQQESKTRGTAGQQESGAHGTAGQQESKAHGTAGQQESETRCAAVQEEKRESGGNSTADGFLAGIQETFPGKRQDVRTYSPLTLAYIGDAVYDLIIRTVVVGRANRPANDLHHITVRYVSANAQSAIVQALMENFTEEERSVYQRGKNSKPHTTAKNASVSDYLKATGFEAVIGYLYLTGRMDRALELVRKGLELAGMGM